MKKYALLGGQGSNADIQLTGTPLATLLLRPGPVTKSIPLANARNLAFSNRIYF